MPVVQTTARPVGVFVVDADPGQRRMLAGLIAEQTQGRFAATACASGAEALAAVGAQRNAILLADLATIGGPTGLSDFARDGLRLIATSDGGSLATAIAVMKAGAVDFLPKPIGARALIARLEATMAAWPDGSQAATPRPEATGTAFAGFVGTSPAMNAVYDRIRRMAPSRAPVFITGESGTGKELCAEAIHAHAGGEGRPFIALNCSAIPRDLMESEIFGHVRGAFTGASENRAGAAELADGGTLFLDEIAEMDLGLQAKLLRFVQSGAFRRVGGSETRQVEVRIVCATNRDPSAEVKAGRFRADLFYRLNVLPIHLPPLRERREDILPLAEHFLAGAAEQEGGDLAAFDGAVRALLVAHDWPGNVRELANAIRRAVVLGDAGEIGTAIAASSGPRVAGTEPGNAGPAVEPYWLQERRIIEHALGIHGGNIARAAAALELNPSTIYRKRQTWAEAAREGC